MRQILGRLHISKQSSILASRTSLACVPFVKKNKTHPNLQCSIFFFLILLDCAKYEKDCTTFTSDILQAFKFWPSTYLFSDFAKLCKV